MSDNSGMERGVFVDHSTVHRWSLKILPVLALVFHIARQWKYLYRAVDKTGDTVDFLLMAKRDKAAARRYLERAINLNLGFKSFRSSQKLIAGIETMHMVKKGQLRCQPISAAEHFYNLAF